MIDLLADRAGVLGLRPEQVLTRDSPGARRRCRLLAAADGWVALNLSRDDDRALLPALAGGSGWEAAAAAAAAAPAASFRDRAAELQLPVAVVGEALPLPLAPAGSSAVPARVLDLSALWAGPMCGGLLAMAGARVLRVESVSRPDPTAAVAPRLDRWLNGAKERLPLDLRSPAARARLRAEVERCDLLITSARAAALARLGLAPGLFPGLGWVAVTGHGFTGAGAARVGFGDDCAAAGGLVAWNDGAPEWRGDALADPLTGLEAALAVLSGRRGFIDMPMARVAAAYAAAP
jgi:hypothetical protein